MARNILISIRGDGRQARSEIDSVSRSLLNFGKNLRNVSLAASQITSGMRQIAQGVQNLGFVTSAFISLPLTRALQGAAKGVVDFERAMVEVEKTTGLSKKQIGELTNQIRQLNLQTPTSAKELADMASEAGRAGVGLGNILAGNVEAARAEIIEFVRVVDMMQVSTTLSAEQAATAFGRLMSIFDELDTTNIENMGSAINELGQSASVNEDDIVQALLRLAPAAAQLEMAPQYAAAFATAIVQMSESASRGGNRLRVALDQMVINWEKAAQLIGTSSQELRERLNTDAVGVLMDLVFAMGGIEDTVTATKASMEIFGTTGSNAIRRLASNFPELVRFVEISNKAFAEGTSLQVEFNRAIDAVSERLKILRSVVEDVGMSFFMDLLPIAKDVIGALIAAFGELNEIVKQLSTQKKLLILAFAALVAVGLPLLALLGSIGFAFSMVLGGVINIVGGIANLAVSMMTLVGAAKALGLSLLAIVPILGITLLTAISKATGAFDSIIDALSDIASRARSWGENIVAEIAGGIVSAAANLLIRAMEFVGSIIDAFLGAHSPPKRGALSDIEKWGRNLIDTYLRAFKTADFGVLKEVTQIISRVFDTMPNMLKATGISGRQWVFEARAMVGQLIAEFNKTGIIRDDILDGIKNMLGDMGDEVTKLIRLQLRYNKAVQQLEDIQRGRTKVDEIYKSEIRAIQKKTDATGIEKLEMIKTARGRRDLARENLDTQESAAQQTVNSLKDQIAWQKEYVDAVLETKEMYSDIAKAMAKLKKAASSVGKAMKDALGDLLEKLRINLALQKEYNDKGLDTKKLLREELNIRKNIVEELLKIKDPTQEQIDMIEENIDRIKELQDLLDTDEAGFTIPEVDISGGYGDIVDQLREQFDVVEEEVVGFESILERGSQAWELFKLGLSGGELDIQVFRDADRGIQRFAKIDGELIPIDETEEKFFEFGKTINGVFDKIEERINKVKDGFNNLKESITDIIDTIFGKREDEYDPGFVPAKDFMPDPGMVKGVAYSISEVFGISPSQIDAIMKKLGELSTKLGEFVTEAIKLTTDVPVTFFETYFSWIKDNGGDVATYIGGIADAIVRIVDALIKSEGVDFKSFADDIKYFEDLQLDTTLGQLKFLSGTFQLLAGAVEWSSDKIGSADLPTKINELIGRRGFTQRVGEHFKESGMLGLRNAIVGLINPFLLLTEAIQGFSDIDLVGLGSELNSMFSQVAEDASLWRDQLVLTLQDITKIDASEIGLGNIELFSPESLAKVSEGIGRWVETMREGMTSARDDFEAWARGTIYGILSVKFINAGINILAKIGTDWLTVISTGLAGVKEEFEEVFKKIGESVEKKIKATLNNVISAVENTINNIVNGVNDIIRSINKVSSAVGIPPIAEIGNVSLPRLARGGIAMSPILAIVGDAPGGEAVLPLNYLKDMLGEKGQSELKMEIDIDINNPTVRNDEDLSEVIRAVSDAIGIQLNNRMLSLGRSF